MAGVETAEESGEVADDGRVAQMTWMQKVQWYLLYRWRSRQIPCICLPLYIALCIALSPLICIYYIIFYFMGRRQRQVHASELDDDPNFEAYINGMGGGWRLANGRGVGLTEAEVITQEPSAQVHADLTFASAEVCAPHVAEVTPRPVGSGQVQIVAPE